MSVVGVPKTIDNDILLLDKTFGFDTAVEEAQKAIQAAAIEAQSAYRGVARGQAHGTSERIHRHVRDARQRRSRLLSHSRD